MRDFLWHVACGCFSLSESKLDEYLPLPGWRARFYILEIHVSAGLEPFHKGIELEDGVNGYANSIFVYANGAISDPCMP